MKLLSLENKIRTLGFTLLETIIVVAIITLFFAISIPMFFRFTAKAKLDTTARSISSALRTARSYAITNNANYYVVFDGSNNKYYIFDGATVVEKEYTLPEGITFSRPLGGDAITFLKDAVTRACFTPTGRLDTDAGAGAAVFIADIEYDWKRIVVIKTTGTVKIDKENTDG